MVRHQSRPTHNYLLLMTAGGAVAATGFLSSPPAQTIAFVSASVIALGVILAGVKAGGHPSPPAPSRGWPQTAWGRKTTRTQASVLCLNV